MSVVDGLEVQLGLDMHINAQTKELLKTLFT
jgi:hypothetical protein